MIEGHLHGLKREGKEETRILCFCQIKVFDASDTKTVITPKRKEIELREWHHHVPHDESYLLDMSHVQLFHR